MFVFLSLLISFSLCVDWEGTFIDDSYENGLLYLCRSDSIVQGTYTKYNDSKKYVVGIIRGVVDGSNNLIGKWYEGGSSWGGFNGAWNNGIVGYWWYHNDGNEQFHHDWTCPRLNTTKPTQSQCKASTSEGRLNVGGTWKTTPPTKLCVNSTVFIGTDDTKQYAGTFYTDHGVLSGTWWDGTNHGSFLWKIIDTSSMFAVYYADTNLKHLKTIESVTQNVTKIVPISLCKRHSGWDGTKNDQVWTGKFEFNYIKNPGEFQYIINVNGKFHGSYPDEKGNTLGIMQGEISADGKRMDGYWIEPNWLGWAYGKIYYLFEAKKNDIFGFYSFGEGTPSSPCGNDTRISEFSSESLSYSVDLDSVVGASQVYDAGYKLNRKENVPRYFCNPGGDSFTGAYWKTIGYMKGSYLRKKSVATGIYSRKFDGDSKVYYGAFMYMIRLNGDIDGWNYEIPDVKTGSWNLASYKRDGPYYVMDETPDSSKCSANARTIPLQPGTEEPDDDNSSGTSNFVLLAFLFSSFFVL